MQSLIQSSKEHYCQIKFIKIYRNSIQNIQINPLNRFICHQYPFPEQRQYEACSSKLRTATDKFKSASQKKHSHTIVFPHRNAQTIPQSIRKDPSLSRSHQQSDTVQLAPSLQNRRRHIVKLRKQQPWLQYTTTPVNTKIVKQGLTLLIQLIIFYNIQQQQTGPRSPFPLKDDPKIISNIKAAIEEEYESPTATISNGLTSQKTPTSANSPKTANPSSSPPDLLTQKAALSILPRQELNPIAGSVQQIWLKLS